MDGEGEQDGLGAFPQLLNTMLPDVCSKHVLVCMMKVYVHVLCRVHFTDTCYLI